MTENCKYILPTPFIYLYLAIDFPKHIFYSINHNKHFRDVVFSFNHLFQIFNRSPPQNTRSAH